MGPGLPGAARAFGSQYREGRGRGSGRTRPSGTLSPALRGGAGGPAVRPPGSPVRGRTRRAGGRQPPGPPPPAPGRTRGRAPPGCRAARGRDRGDRCGRGRGGPRPSARPLRGCARRAARRRRSGARPRASRRASAARRSTCSSASRSWALRRSRAESALAPAGAPTSRSAASPSPTATARTRALHPVASSTARRAAWSEATDPSTATRILPAGRFISRLLPAPAAPPRQPSGRRPPPRAPSRRARARARRARSRGRGWRAAPAPARAGPCGLSSARMRSTAGRATACSSGRLHGRPVRLPARTTARRLPPASAATAPLGGSHREVRGIADSHHLLPLQLHARPVPGPSATASRHRARRAGGVHAPHPCRRVVGGPTATPPRARRRCRPRAGAPPPARGACGRAGRRPSGRRRGARAARAVPPYPAEFSDASDRPSVVRVHHLLRRSSSARGGAGWRAPPRRGRASGPAAGPRPRPAARKRRLERSAAGDVAAVRLREGVRADQLAQLARLPGARERGVELVGHRQVVVPGPLRPDPEPHEARERLQHVHRRVDARARPARR